MFAAGSQNMFDENNLITGVRAARTELSLQGSVAILEWERQGRNVKYLVERVVRYAVVEDDGEKQDVIPGTKYFSNAPSSLF